MPTDLRAKIAELANRFAMDVLGAVAAALDENIFARGSGETARRAPGGRRRSVDVAAQGERVLSVLRRQREGLRAENLRRELGVDKGTFSRVLERLVTERKVKKTGERRRTTYFLSGDARADGRSKSKKAGTEKPSSSAGAKAAE